jgi:hypothetical protein
MLKALVWKEYREQRQVALMGLLVSAMLPVLFIVVGYAVAGSGSASMLPDLLQASAMSGVALVGPIFAAVAGAATNLPESQVAALGYLLSRPVSRQGVWAVKVGIGALSLATIVMGAVAIQWALHLILMERAARTPLAYLRGAPILDLMGFLLLTFACSALFTTLTSSPLVAAGGGLVSSVAIHVIVYGSWAVAGLYWNLERVSSIEIGVVILLVFACSAYTFRRGELMRGRSVRRLVLAQAVLALVVLLIVSTCFAYGLARVTAENAVFFSPQLIPGHEAFAVRANSANAVALEVWRIDMRGQASRLIGRGASSPTFSRGGKWIAYQSRSLVLPYLSLDELRLIRTDGSGDRGLGRGYLEPPVFSPDGRRLAATSGEQLTIGYVDRYDTSVIDLSDRYHARRVVWTPDGDELLLTSLSQDLAFYDLDSGGLREFEPPEGWLDFYEYALPTGRPVPARMPVSGYWLERTGEVNLSRRYNRVYGIGLIDRETLEAEVLARDVCSSGPLDLSGEERFLVYARCDPDASSEAQEGRSRSVVRMPNTVRLRDLQTGEDRPLLTVRGNVGDLSFSPSGDAIVMSTWHGPVIFRLDDAEARTVLDLRENDPGPQLGWLAVGWLDSYRLALVLQPAKRENDILFRAQLASRPRMPPGVPVGNLAVLDVNSGELRIVFERKESER